MASASAAAATKKANKAIADLQKKEDQIARVMADMKKLTIDHKKLAKVAVTESKKAAVASAKPAAGASKASGSKAAGPVIHTGPKGGQYYITENGTKKYI